MVTRPRLAGGSPGVFQLAVIVPFEGPAPATVDRLVELVADDMQRVNATILSRTGSQVTRIPEVANGNSLSAAAVIAEAEVMQLGSAKNTARR